MKTIFSIFLGPVVHNSANYRSVLITLEFLTSATPADEPEVIKLGHLVLHDSRTVAKFRTVVLVVSRPDGDEGAVQDVSKCHHFECDGQSLVGAPMRRKDGAHKVRTSCPDQFSWMLGQKVPQRPLRQDVRRHLGIGVIEDTVAAGAAALRGRRRRRAASSVRRQVHGVRAPEVAPARRRVFAAVGGGGDGSECLGAPNCGVSWGHTQTHGTHCHCTVMTGAEHVEPSSCRVMQFFSPLVL